MTPGDMRAKRRAAPFPEAITAEGRDLVVDFAEA